MNGSEMVGYAVYKKKVPGPMEVIRYDQHLGDQELDSLVGQLVEQYHYADIVGDL
ncbi:MAG: hypothetical protein ABI923_03815 [bacterium]